MLKSYAYLYDLLSLFGFLVLVYSFSFLSILDFQHSLVYLLVSMHHVQRMPFWFYLCIPLPLEKLSILVLIGRLFSWQRSFYWLPVGYLWCLSCLYQLFYHVYISCFISVVLFILFCFTIRLVLALTGTCVKQNSIRWYIIRRKKNVIDDVVIFFFARNILPCETFSITVKLFLGS